MTQLRLLRAVNEEAPSEQERRTELSRLFEMARRGEIPRSRELLAHEPLSLNERHLQAVMMRAMGMRQCDIARALDYTDSTVSIILNHPDAAFILDQMAGMSAVDAADIDGRLQRLNSRAVEVIEELFEAADMKEAQLASLKARAGFTLLERNLGKKKHVEHEHTHSFKLDPQEVGLLSRALVESRRVEAEMTSFTPAGSMVQISGPVPALPSDIDPPPVGAPQESF
jgi:transcriptional regulator